jgi:CheY-like chemotaxis protein
MSQGSSNTGPVVVCVDDIRENLLVVQAVAEWAGYTFYAASSGSECLGLVSRIIPRLILLDVQMPWMDGFETCRRIRAIDELAAVPVAFLTAKKTIDDLREGMSAGGNDFILKPVDPTVLLERIAYWTTRRAPLNGLN